MIEQELLDRLDPESYVVVLGGDAELLARAGHRVTHDIDAGPFDAVLAAEGVLNEDLGALARLRRVLPPGGLLLFDLACPAGRDPMLLEDHERLVITREDERTRTRTTFRSAGGSEWRRTDRTEALHDPDSVIEQLRGQGFAAHALRRSAGAPIPRGRAVFIAD